MCLYLYIQKQLSSEIDVVLTLRDIMNAEPQFALRHTFGNKKCVFWCKGSVN